MEPTNYEFFNVRASAVLTTSYVAGNIISYKNANPSKANQLIIYADFTIGSLTDAQLKVEFSHDGTAYYQESFSSISSTTDTLSLGVHKMAGTGKFRIAIPIKDNYIKISAIGTGTVTNSLLTLDAIIGTV